MSICPKCKKEVQNKFIRCLSRFSDDYVCDKCGAKEALQVAYEAKAISKDAYERGCSKIDSFTDMQQVRNMCH